MRAKRFSLCSANPKQLLTVRIFPALRYANVSIRQNILFYVYNTKEGFAMLSFTTSGYITTRIVT